MIFETLNQVVAFLTILEKLYSIVRIKSIASEEVLYDSENPDMHMLTEIETPVSFAGHCNAAFAVNGIDPMVITITIPMSVGEDSYRLELIHRDLRGRKNMVSTRQDDLIRHLRKLTITDELTNVYNRRYIYEQLPIDLARSFQKDEPISIIYADIDCFKDINDNYGHVTGDLVLKEIAELFRRQVQQEGGWAARYAGDEFLICLPSASHTLSVKIANRICKMVEAKEFNINANTLKITSSFGVETIYKGNGVDTVDEIVELADRKLYRAKRKGGNRVID